MTPASVVVVGSLHLDLMVNTPGRPRLGETMVGTAWAMRPGGKGGNQAVAAARHGAQVAMVGLVGDDDFGRRLLANLRDSGVNAEGVGVCRAAGSGMSVALLEPSGDYGAVIVSGANLHLDPAAIAAAAPTIASARCLLLQNEVPAAANLTAARLAHRSGARVIMNGAPARPLDPALAGLLQILVVNGLEAESLCGIAVGDLAAAAEAAERLTAQAPCAIVTAGGSGVAMAVLGGAALTLPAERVKVVSTHGAGDVFVGTLAARLAAGEAPEQALGHANAAAAALVAGVAVS
jgi:ribokinase